MQDLLRYSEREFHKGYCDSMKPENLPTGYAADALNCIVEDDTIKKRHGYTIVGNDVGSMAGLGLGVLETAAGLKRVVAAWNDAGGTNSRYMAWSGSGDFVDITGTTTQTKDTLVNFEQASNKLYSFNGVDTCLAYNGTNASPIADIPVGKYAKWFNNFFFVAGNSSYPSRLYFSGVGTPETWDVGDYLDVNPDDGDSITGLNALGSELLITKKNKVYAFTGMSIASFAFKDMNERINGFGNISHRSLQNIGNDTLFLSFVGTIPHIRSIKRTQYAVNVAGGIISDNITGTLDAVNKSKLDISASVFDGRRYCLAMPNGASTYNNLMIVYDTVNKGFTRWTGVKAASFVISTIGGKAEIYFQEAGPDAKVYKMDTSDSDNGAAIDFQYKTRAFICRGELGDNKADTKAKWKYLYLTADSGSDVNLLVEGSRNTFEFDTLMTVNLIGTSSVLPFILPMPLGVPSAVRERVNIGGSPSNMMQYKFSQAEADKPVTIREYSVLFKPKRLRNS